MENSIFNVAAINTMQIKELDTGIYCKYLKDHGCFARMGVIGDGSCFFHSVCSMTNRNEYLFQNEARQKEIAYEFRCKFKNQFSRKEYEMLSAKSSEPKSFETESDGFCSPKVWADEVMIRFASKTLNINLVFLDINSGKAYCGVHGDESLMKDDLSDVTQPTGIVAWINHAHFEPIVRIDNPKTGEITTLFEPSKSKEDEKFVRMLMGRYASGCKINSPHKKEK